MKLFDSRLLDDEAPATAPDQLDSYREYSGKGSPIKPERIYAVWERRSTDFYVLGAWELKDLYVTGRIIKKDGGLGLVHRECHFIRWGKQLQAIPAWVSSAINAAIPE